MRLVGRPRLALSFGVFALGVVASKGEAQILGPYRFQLAPYCNVLTVTVIPVPTGFQVSGTDNGCGADAQGTFGTAFASGADVKLSLVTLAPTGNRAMSPRRSIRSRVPGRGAITVGMAASW